MGDPLRIVAPDARAAFALAEALDWVGAVAANERTRWEVTVPLDGASRGTVPAVLSEVREWLLQCDVSATSVVLDGHAHLICREPSGGADTASEREHAGELVELGNVVALIVREPEDELGTEVAQRLLERSGTRERVVLDHE